MMGLGLRVVLPAGFALLGAATVAAWLLGTRVQDVAARVPAPPETAALATKKPAKAVNSGTTITGPGNPSRIQASWPQFRGADRTNIVRDGASLAREWPSGGPPVLWKMTVGEGHAGPAIRNGCIYLVDYDQEKEEDAIRCLSLDDGREVWRYTYSVKIKRNHGMSRTVPAVSDRYVVSLGPMCHVTCLEADTGKLVWHLDLVKEFGASVPPWYAGQCPLIDGDAVILAPGATPLMMAVDLATGRTVWKTPNPGGLGMTHASITPMDYHGQRQYIYCSTEGVVSVSAQDGRILWRKPDWKIALATVPSPLVVSDDRLFFSGGYNSGCAMVRVKGQGDALETEEVFRRKVSVFGAEQHTPILYQDYIYGVASGGELVCLDLDGNRVWSSGVANRFGLGPFILAEGLLFVLNDQTGTLHLIEASPAGYNELSRAHLLEGHDAWGPMALVDGRLILRDLTTLMCVDVSGERQ